MLGFYSTKTAKLLFGVDLIHKLSNTLFIGGAIVFALSSLLALGILEFNIEDTHSVARNLTGAFLIISATLVAIHAGINIAKNNASPYGVLPLLITPIAFIIYGIDLFLTEILLETVYTKVYVIGLLINSVLYSYALLVIRKSKRLIAFFLILQFSLAVTLLLLIHHNRALATSLILWVSLLQFSLSLTVGSKIIQAEQIPHKKGPENEINNRYLPKISRETKNGSDKARIFIWLPDKEMGAQNVTIPWIGKYFFAYSFQQSNFMVGHIVVQTKDFYASIYPDQDSFLKESAKATFPKEIGHSHRMFHSGYWSDFKHDLEKRGSDYVKIEIDVHDSQDLFKTWDVMKEVTDYSLYSRNCAVVSIQLFDACIHKTLSSLPFIRTLARVYFSTNFWSAVIAKQRSEMFLWTPGLAYDYICNLQQLISKLHR